MLDKKCEIEEEEIYMKKVKILGMGRVDAERNGVTRVEYFEALGKVSKWSGLPPYQVDYAIQDKKKELKV